MLEGHAVDTALKRPVDLPAEELGHGVVGGAQRKLHADRQVQRPLQDRARSGGAEDEPSSVFLVTAVKKELGV